MDRINGTNNVMNNNKVNKIRVVIVDDHAILIAIVVILEVIDNQKAYNFKAPDIAFD